MVSTGQGVLGCNMFAYCLNNPVVYKDDTGNSPFSIFLSLLDYYFIHKEVQYTCANLMGWETEVYVKGPLGKGRLDLLDKTVNKYYEVKSFKAYVRKDHKKQLDKYDVAIIADTKRNRDKKVEIGATISKGNKTVQGSFEYGFWDVTFESKEPGIITYDTKFNYQRAIQTDLTALGTIVLLILAPQMLQTVSPGFVN